MASTRTGGGGGGVGGIGGEVGRENGLTALTGPTVGVGVDRSSSMMSDIYCTDIRFLLKTSSLTGGISFSGGGVMAVEPAGGGLGGSDAA